MSPLLDAPYDDRDLDLVRFRPSAIDDRISMVVARSSVASDDELRRMREDMDDDDVVLLDIFALRRSVAAWRSGSIGLALEALDATILPPGSARNANHDFRFVLYVALAVGVSDDDVDARVDRATGNALRALHRDRESLDRATDVSQLGYAEVHSSYGVGFLHLTRGQTQVDPQWLAGASIIHSGSPIVHSPAEDAAPSVNLASLVVDIADAIDAFGAPTGSIGVATLAAQWFSESPSASFVPTLGCLNFSVVTTGVSDGYVDVFVAELPPDIDPSELAQLATSNDLLDERIVAASRGAVLVLLCPAPFGLDDLDDEDDADDTVDADVEVGAPSGGEDDGRAPDGEEVPHGPSLADLLSVAEDVIVREVSIA